MKKKKQSRRKRKLGLRIIFSLLVLLVVFALLSFMTPSEAEYGIMASGEIPNLEIPQGVEGQVVTHTGYTLSYNEQHEVPNWVAYELTKEKVASQETPRKDNFREDPAILTLSATLDDYKGSGYDRGHMAPAADFKWSKEAMDDTFYLSNMCPQNHNFNGGIWNDLEAAVRSMAYDNGRIYVVTGPVLTDGPYETIGKSQVAVPKRYYKVILDYSDPEVKAIGFVMKGENSSKPLSTFAMTVDQVEEITGIDFFPLLPDDEEEIIEATMDVSLWSLRAFDPSKVEATEAGYQFVSPQTEKERKLMDLALDVFMHLKKDIFRYLGITEIARKLGFI